jgi:hypothetical protein
MRHLPHTSIKAVKKEQPLLGITLMKDAIDVQGLILSLDTHFKKTWKTFEIIQPLSEIKDFGEQIAGLGKKHNSATIIGYGEDLILAADSFNIEEILKLLGKYIAVVESIKN